MFRVGRELPCLDCPETGFPKILNHLARICLATLQHSVSPQNRRLDALIRPEEEDLSV